MSVPATESQGFFLHIIFCSLFRMDLSEEEDDGNDDNNGYRSSCFNMYNDYIFKRCWMLKMESPD